jgi:hypothetical protein
MGMFEKHLPRDVEVQKVTIVLPLHITILTPCKWIDLGQSLVVIIRKVGTLRRINISTSIQVSSWTVWIAVCRMFVHFTLIIFMESKTDVVGTTTVGDDQLIAWSALAAVKVTVHFRLVNTNTSLTTWTKHGVMVCMVDTVPVHLTFRHKRRVTGHRG